MQQKHSKPASVSGSDHVCRGSAALVSVIIVVVATLLMAVTASRLGIGELDLGYTTGQGGEAFAVADGCMEEALRRIRLDTNYGVGQGTLSATTTNGSCTIEVSGSGSTRTITVKGTQDSYHAKLRSTLSLSGNVITITSWAERDD